MFKYAMGAQARDSITGFEGTITARYEFINGCRRYQLEALRDGDLKELVFDEERVVVLAAEPARVEARVTGGPRAKPPRTGTR